MQDQASPERTNQPETFSETLRRCFDKYKGFQCDSDTVPAFRFRRDTHDETRIVDITVFPYRYDHAPKSYITNAPIDGDRHPARILTEFTGSTETVADVFAIADIFTSDEFKELCASSDYFLNDRSCMAIVDGTRRSLCNRATGLIARTEEGAEAFLSELSARLQDEALAEHILPLVPAFEVAFTKYLIDVSSEDAPMPEAVARIAQVARKMEEEGLLKDETEALSLLSTPKILIYPEFAELLTARLRSRPARTNRLGEIHYHLTARLLLEEVLGRYSEENNRHLKNIEIIQKLLFPTDIRSDSLSRAKLIGLANSITRSSNELASRDERQDLLDPFASGILGEALERVLAITTAKNATSEEAKSHRLQDHLYAELIGMLLEQRQTAA